MDFKHQKALNDFLSCPKCQRHIMLAQNTYKCTHCNLKYNIDNDVPIMLIEDAINQSCSTQKNPVKEKAKNQFTTIAESLENNPLSRFIKFLNYGYANLAHKHTTTIKQNDILLNKNQKQLLTQLIYPHNLNNKIVLEIGCGRGGNIETLNKAHSPKITIGMDIAEANIQFCQNQYKLSNTYFLVGDAEKVPLKSKKFDSIINIESSYAYTNIFNFYDDVYRLLKTDGYFLYTDIFDRSKVSICESYLKNIGFTIIKNIDITQNVLASLKQISKSYLVSHKNLRKKDIEYFNEVAAIPGSNRFKKMEEGIQQYRLYQLTKSSTF